VQCLGSVGEGSKVTALGKIRCHNNITVPENRHYETIRIVIEAVTQSQNRLTSLIYGGHCRNRLVIGVSFVCQDYISSLGSVTCGVDKGYRQSVWFGCQAIRS
jgi:hypothetical protein